jgi:hypothetical protein
MIGPLRRFLVRSSDDLSWVLSTGFLRFTLLRGVFGFGLAFFTLFAAFLWWQGVHYSIRQLWLLALMSATAGAVWGASLWGYASFWVRRRGPHY